MIAYRAKRHSDSNQRQIFDNQGMVCEFIDDEAGEVAYRIFVEGLAAVNRQFGTGHTIYDEDAGYYATLGK